MLSILNKIHGRSQQLINNQQVEKVGTDGVAEFSRFSQIRFRSIFRFQDLNRQKNEYAKLDFNQYSTFRL